MTERVIVTRGLIKHYAYYELPVTACLHNFHFSFFLSFLRVTSYLTVHLAAAEGHLPCVKFLVCSGASIDHALNARNDQVILPCH